MNKIIILILLTSYFLTFGGKLQSQQVSPSVIEEKVRFNKIIGKFKVKNPTTNRLIFDLIPYEFSVNEKGETIVSNNEAEEVTITPKNVALSPNQEQIIRVSIGINPNVSSREIAVCTVEKRENLIGQESQSNLILRNCMKVSGSRNNVKFDNIQ